MTILRAGPLALLCLCLPLVLNGCVLTDSAYVPTADAGAAHPPGHRNPGEIQLTESIDVGRAYKVIGRIDASGRMLNLASSNPTRADVDEALRAEAAKRGADAVVRVRYETDAAGLATRGRIGATGFAVVFKS